MTWRRPLLALLLLPAAAGPSAAAGKAAYKHYLRALLLTNQGSYPEALKEYEAALQLDPESAFMYQQAAELALEMGSTDRALELARRFADLSPENHQAHYLLANVHWARGEFDAARRSFERTLELKPDYQEALFALGNLLSAQSPGAARKYLKDYLANNPENASEAEYQMAVLEQKAGRLEEAAAHLRSSIELEPENMQARFSLAQLYEARRDTEAALGQYLEILERDPQNVPLLNHVGEIYYLKDDLAGARERFERAKAIAPSNPAACLWLALLAEQEEDFKAAAEHLTDSSALPQDPALHLRLSYYLTQDDRLKEAVQTLERAHRRWPKNWELAYFLALGYDDLKQPAKAVSLMRQVVAQRPDHRDARFQLGALHEKTGDIAAAEAEFRELLSLYPHDASALNYLGYSLADRGLKLDEARAFIEKAVELKPDHGAYVDSLGWVYFRQGRLPEAREAMEEAVRLLPGDDVVWSHLAEVYTAQGADEEAFRAWKQAQFLAPAKPELAKKVSAAERRLPEDRLAALYQEFLIGTQGGLASYGGGCVIEGRLGGKSFKFQGLLHYRRERGLQVEVLGPLFAPVFRATVLSDGAFEMDPLLEVEGADPDFLRDRLHEALGLVKDYLSGRLLEGEPVELRSGWRGSRLLTPEAALELNKTRTLAEAAEPDEPEGLRLELERFQPVEGRWVPALLRLKARGFVLTLELSGISAGVDPR